MVRQLEETLLEGHSLRSVARNLGVQPTQLRKWRAQKVSLAQSKIGKKSIGRGKKSSIQHLEDQIIPWALHQREAGVPLRYKSLQLQACRLDPAFREKNKSQQYHMIRRLCIANCLDIRETTHVAQRRLDDTRDEALQWLTIARPIVSANGVQQKFILNMDQTPVPVSLHPGRTLAQKGSNTVAYRSTKGSVNRITVSLTISSAGDKLKPFLIFHGKPAGRIATRELPTNPNRHHVAMVCQPSAWQDDSNMLVWIDQVLVPYLQEKAQGVPVLLFLDSFQVHHSASTEARLEDLGIIKHQLPEGCTSLIHPIDVGIGKFFKDRLKEHWWDWRLEQNPERSVTMTPSRELLSTWVKNSWDEIPADIVRNTWRKTGMSYFPTVGVVDNNE